VVKRHGGDGAVLRQCDRGFVSDLGLGRRRIDDEDERLAGAVAEVDCRADGAKVVRAWTRRDDDQLGNGNHALDCHGDRWRSVDDCKAEALLPEHFEIRSQTGDGGLGKGRHVGFPFVPPIGKAALRVDVDQADRACPRHLRLHRKMTGQGRLARPALLRCQCQDAHAFPLTV
jgi:hypothetical protein